MSDRGPSPEPFGTVQVLPDAGSADLWQPVVGAETDQLLPRLQIPSPENEDRAVKEALSIVARSVRPGTPKTSETGLAMGYIQSGKTLSFTLVTALARDNGYALVVVIAGTSLNLFAQSEARLRHDLDLTERRDRKWMTLSNPSMPAEVQSLRAAFDNWRDPALPRQSVLVTVMKNHARLKKLTKVLSRVSLEGIPTLIIDDEGDQASLNAKVQNQEMTTTYRSLLALRAVIPEHTFLQYTATPQAPLMISLIDTLSPRFATLLTPGDNYTGGRMFFVDRPEVIKVIPESELHRRRNQLLHPPPSLLTALRLFYLGVANGLMVASPEFPKGNRSMLIHPSQEVAGHATYLQWVTAIKNDWTSVLGADRSDPDYEGLLQEFAADYADLAATAQDIGRLEDIVRYLPRAISSTVITEMNTRQTVRAPQVQWRDIYSHILVGGQAMDRGFTVEGLTVTYMPRSLGVGNVDTIQQRARFFGYKQSYYGFCRVFLEQAAVDAYQHYVQHEEYMRRSLVEHGDKPLIDWKREFLLDSRFKLTRRSVLGFEYLQGNYRDQWFRPMAPQRDPDAVRHNNQLANSFLDSIPNWEELPGHTPMQTHNVARGLPLDTLLSKLLVPLRLPDQTDSLRFTGLLLQLQTHLEENPKALTDVYQMSQGTPRVRNLGKDGDFELFQGRNPLTGPATYPGDSEIHSRLLSIQVHTLDIDGQEVVIVAVWVPKVYEMPWAVT